MIEVVVVEGLDDHVAGVAESLDDLNGVLVYAVRVVVLSQGAVIVIS